MSDNKRKAETAFEMPSDVDDDHCPKRYKSSDPDVKVIVGGETFYHYSTILIDSSDYFDRMLASNMKEGITKVITFPDKDPEHWKLVSKYLGTGASTQTVDLNHIEVLTDLFREWQMIGGLCCCDRALRSFVREEWQDEHLRRCLEFGTTPLSRQEAKQTVKVILEKFQFSTRHDLQGTVKECSYFFKRVLKHGLSLLDDDSIVQLASIISTEEAPRKHLLPSIQALLPSLAPEMNPKDALNASLLIGIIKLKADAARRR